ncbi:peptidase U32 family protein [Paenibacillus thermoaerophilus]|uniref:Peptidase U32 family protein n=1 Tax=Paenibacillus thermoaerophilus TaxID=1215385 RepID=A0ABW2UX40_9BACL|nr:peptidase U32 family protein [Paenibacillus thermoaerophilus]TMV17348.1 U32 family peptidase [Paenibacillus thermoaerophilus]
MQSRKKPELLATCSGLDEARLLLDAGADALYAGEQAFGLRLPGDVKLPELAEIASLAHSSGRKLYVAVNKIFDNEELDDLSDYVYELANRGIADAITFGDPAVLMVMKDRGVKLPLHWNAEMTVTNAQSANYWGARGATRAVLARELNLEEIVKIKRASNVEIQVQVHGMTNIYHSKRNLLDGYLDHLGRSGALGDLGLERGLYLIEAERPEERFPIYQDANGTHIMSSDDYCMLENLPELFEAGIDSFKIEGLLKTPAYNETVVRAYRKAIDACAENPDAYVCDEDDLAAIRALQDPKRELSFGFFYKEQVY